VGIVYSAAWPPSETRLYLRRRGAKITQRQLPNKIEIALACTHKVDNFLRDYCSGEVRTSLNSERYARHFKCEARNALGLWIEFNL
jgi:hypothetical protein